MARTGRIDLTIEFSKLHKCEACHFNTALVGQLICKLCKDKAEEHVKRGYNYITKQVPPGIAIPPTGKTAKQWCMHLPAGYRKQAISILESEKIENMKYLSLSEMFESWPNTGDAYAQAFKQDAIMQENQPTFTGKYSWK